MVSRRAMLGALAASAGSLTLASTTNATAQFGTLDAEANGIVPFTGQDLSAELEALIWRASERGQGVYLPAGDYVASGIKLPSNARIVGARGQTRITTPQNAAVFVGNSSHNVVLENLTLVGTGERSANENFGLVDFVNSDQFKLSGCAFANSAVNGASLYRTSGEVVECFFADIEGAAIKTVDATGLLISRNKIDKIGNNGILVWRNEQGHDGTIVTENHVSNIDWRNGGNGQNGNGINVFRAGDVIVSNNVIVECAFSAVRANASLNCQIISNNCRNLYEVAIFSEFGFSGSIIANNQIDATAHGISITNLDDNGYLAVCANNIVRNIWTKSPYNPDTFPVGILAEADTIVSGNAIENVPGYAIMAGWGPFLRNVSVTDNIIRKAAYGVYVSIVDGVGATQVKDNMLDQIAKASVVGGRWHEIAETDLQGNSDDYPLVQASGNISS